MSVGPLGLALMITACGGEKEVPVANIAANIAQARASAPIIFQNPVANQDSENVSEAVSRGTGVNAAAPSPDHGSDSRYRAIGTEPFWAVTVKGSTATLERPDRMPIRYTVSRNDDERAIRYLGDGFAMTVTEGPCSDGMSDAVWSDRVAVAFREGTLNGCGGMRDDQETP